MSIDPQPEEVAPTESALDTLVAAMQRTGWKLLPDSVDGYGAVMLAAHKEREAAVAIAHVQPGSLPLLALTTRPGHCEEDIAEVLDIARRASVPSLDGEDDRRIVSEKALALEPSQMFVICDFDKESGRWRRWVTSVPRDPKPAFLSRLAARIVADGGQVLSPDETPDGYSAAHVLPERVPAPNAVAVQVTERPGVLLLSLAVREGQEEADKAMLVNIADRVALPVLDGDPRRLEGEDIEEGLLGFIIGGREPDTGAWCAFTGGLPRRDEPPA